MAKSVSKPPEEKSTPKKQSSQKPRNAEQAAFEKASEEGHDPNRLENPHATVMDRAKAEEIVKKYDGFTGTEVPTELEVARKVLGNQKPADSKE